MSEDDATELSINELRELLTKSTSELVELSNSANIAAFDAKNREVKLIQRIIVIKRAEEKPSSLL